MPHKPLTRNHAVAKIFPPKTLTQIFTPPRKFLISMNPSTCSFCITQSPPLYQCSHCPFALCTSCTTNYFLYYLHRSVTSSLVEPKTLSSQSILVPSPHSCQPSYQSSSFRDKRTLRSTAFRYKQLAHHKSFGSIAQQFPLGCSSGWMAFHLQTLLRAAPGRNSFGLIFSGIIILVIVALLLT